MRITMIHGQNHAGSSCHIGRSIARGLAAPEDCREFFLPRDLNHFCTDWENVNPKKQEKIRRHVQKLIRKLKDGKAPRVGLFTRFRFLFLGRMMQAAGMGSSAYEKEYWQQMGWLGKARPWKPREV